MDRGLHCDYLSSTGSTTAAAPDPTSILAKDLLEFHTSLATLAESVTSTVTPRSSTQSELIDAYFTFAHGLLPIFDETEFRSRRDELQSDCDGGPALLNMVLAMGSLAQTQTSNEDHVEYYKRAIESLDGSRGVKALQTLLIMGGQYLPLVDERAHAETIIGDAIQLAGMIGPAVLAQGRDEAWRRALWCLYCLHGSVGSKLCTGYIDMVRL